jgi:allene oxide cyclase
MRSPVRFALTAALAVFQVPAFAGQHMQFIDTDETLVAHVGPKGDAPGDIMTFKGVLTHVDGKKQVGSEQGFCIRIAPADKSWECSFTVILADGQIAVTGPFVDSGDSKMTVVGGTGAYVGAKGTLLVHLRGTTPETDLFTFDLN